MSGVVVDYEMDIEVRCDRLLEPVEGSDEILVPVLVLLHALADHPGRPPLSGPV